MQRLYSRELSDHAHALAWSPDGVRLAVATLAGDVAVLHAESGEAAWTRPALHAGGALALAFSPDGSHLVSGGQDGKLRILHGATGEEIRALDAGGDWAAHLVWPEEDDTFASAAGRAVRFWSRDGELRGEATSHPSTVSALFHHPGLGVFGAAHYGGITFLVPGEKKPARKLAYRGAICVAAPSPSGRFVASGNQDTTVRFWDLAAKADASLTGYPEKVRVLVWSPDGMLLATGGGKNIIAWVCAGGVTTPIGTRPLQLSHHEKRVSGLAFSQDGRAIFSAGEDGRLCHWEGGEFQREDRIDRPLLGLAMHAQTGLLACAAGGATLSVWRTSDR